MISAGARNCQTETPAARIETSSLLRLSRQNDHVPDLWYDPVVVRELAIYQYSGQREHG